MACQNQDRKFRILFLIHDLGGGGAERVLVNLVNGLDSSRFDITLISLFGGGIYEKSIRTNIKLKTIFKHSIPGNSYWMKALPPRKLHDLFIKEHYDLEIAYLEGPVSRIISGCPDPSTKLICWVHTQLKNLSELSKSFRSIYEAKDCYLKFDKIACVSQEIKRDILTILPNNKGIEVIHNVQDSPRIVTQAAQWYSDPFELRADYRLIGIGKLTEKKGFDKLLNIHKRLIKNGISVQTIILGDGPLRKKLQSQIEENNITETARLVGFQKNPYPYLKNVDLFICSSAVEGYSTATAESLILQIPVVSTPVSGARELLGDLSDFGVTADYSEDAIYNAIYRLLTNQTDYQRYKNNLYEKSSQFNYEKLIEENELFLLSMLKSGEEEGGCRK